MTHALQGALERVGGGGHFLQFGILGQGSARRFIPADLKTGGIALVLHRFHQLVMGPARAGLTLGRLVQLGAGELLGRLRGRKVDRRGGFDGL